VKYYYHPASPNCRKVTAVIDYLGFQAEHIVVDLPKGEQMSPEFLAINPNGRVPTLVDGNRTLWESNAIIIYLAEKAASDMWPDDDRRLDDVRVQARSSRAGREHVPEGDPAIPERSDPLGVGRFAGDAETGFDERPEQVARVRIVLARPQRGLARHRAEDQQAALGIGDGREAVDTHRHRCSVPAAADAGREPSTAAPDRVAALSQERCATPDFSRIVSIRHQCVKADWSRFKPTKAVKRCQ